MAQPKDEEILRCLLYEMFTLALSVQSLGQVTWPDNLCYELFARDAPKAKQGRFDPAELVQSAALMKFRCLYQFFYAPTGDNRDIEAAPLLSKYGPLRWKNETAIRGLYDPDSSNRYVAHLSLERITKSKAHQHKFARGRRETIEIAKLFLEDAELFVSHIRGNPSFPGLDRWGKWYLKVYHEVMAKLA